MNKSAQRFPSSLLIYLGLGLITLALYLPALHHGFVDYDDQQYVTDNPRVQAGLTWKGFVWAFGFHAANWHPLAWLSHMLDCQLYGAWAGGHHLTSLLVHTGSTLLLFSVLNRMTKAPWRSAAVAGLFAWHPLHVESVAWVAERKDVLCAFFWMLTLWGYVRFVEQFKVRSPKSKVFYGATLLAFALALMAKPMAVTLPFVLLLLDYWPLNRIRNSEFGIRNFLPLLVEKIPFLLLSGGACVLTMQAQAQGLAIVSAAGLPVSSRIVHALAAYNHYLVAMFVPRQLAVYYPYEFHLRAWTIVCAVAVLVLATLLAIKNLRGRPYLMTGWLWYLGTLVPVIGLVQVGDQDWADRYTYIPLIGLFIPVVWLACDTIKNRMVLQVMSLIVAVALIAATSVQLGYWKNTRTLFEHAAKVTSQNALAVTILGSLLGQEGKLDAAMEYYRTALSYRTNFPEAHFYMGNALDAQGKLDEAVAEYQKALWFRPIRAQTHIFMGVALAKQQKYNLAITNYNAALKLDPDSAPAHNNLARLYHTQGRYDEAITHYHAALEIDPKLSIAHNNLGILLIEKGEFANGTLQLREAMQLNPTNTETQLNLAFALNRQQQWPEAAELLSKVVPGDLPDPRAHYEYAVALFHLKKTRAAMSEYAIALLMRPDYPDALDGLAWILSTDASADFRNGTQAVTMAERACALTGRNDPAKLRTLAAAYAEAGRFEEAVRTVNEAIDSAAQPQSETEQSQRMVKQFQLSQPWRAP